MPVIPPRLDDLDFAKIEAMLRARIPVVAPEWTNHNDSDPGIALIQLFAYLSEQIGYRLNRVPEKTYVEFLKLVGVELRASVAASTSMAFFLAKPERAVMLALPAGTAIKGTGSDGKPQSFETDAGLDVLPAQLAALVTTRGELTRIQAVGEAGPGTGDAASWTAERFSLAWDGKTPKLKDMPVQPLRLFTRPSEESHTTLYLALAFNPSVAAGFKGARASLSLQLDDDEQPVADAIAACGEAITEVVNGLAGDAPLADYAYYRSPLAGAANGAWEPLPLIADSTDGWTRSGTIRFDVPMQIGPIPDAEWADIQPGTAHPLVGALKTPVEGTPAAVPVSGWIRVRFAHSVKMSLRALGFNHASASNLTSTTSERLGRGNGRVGQVLSLSQGNVAAGTLDLVSRDDTAAQPILAWRQVADFDGEGPEAAVYALDAESGVIVFGDGLHGRPPRASELMIARSYRTGGGKAGELPTGQIDKASGLPAAIAGCVNVVPARGGRNAETLEDAKARAPRAFRARGRAVTTADFADAARAAPGVRIARAAVVPLRRPYPEGHVLSAVDAPGIDFDNEAPGAVTVIAVPDRAGLYPVPTRGELRAVAAHLDSVRLLTTEVFVTTPQYVRLHDLQIVVRAAAGYSLALLREAIGDRLRQRFHVLTGGADGRGYPFGALLHHADLVAEVVRVPGVERVEGLSCLFDGTAPDNAEASMNWRAERQTTLRLTNCRTSPADFDAIDLFGDEVPFIDTASLTISITGAP